MKIYMHTLKNPTDTYMYIYMYRILLSKGPWALEFHGSINGGGC